MLTLPAEPCQRLPEKSCACTDGGKKRAAMEAGKVAMITASSAATAMKTQGQNDRAGGADRAAPPPRPGDPAPRPGGLLPRPVDLSLRLGKRDTGIHHSGPGRAIHCDRLNRETIARIECGDPTQHGIERRGFQLHAHTS